MYLIKGTCNYRDEYVHTDSVGNLTESVIVFDKDKADRFKTEDDAHKYLVKYKLLDCGWTIVNEENL